jgi:hypothetical protein
MKVLLLRTPLLVLTIALATVLGAGGAISGTQAAPTRADGPSLDRIEREVHDARVALRTYELVEPPPHLGLVPVASAPRSDAARHRRAAKAVARVPATHASHLMLLTHQRNDLDA